MRFEYLPMPQWPLLTWLSRCDRRSSTTIVAHGRGVETQPDWFCEAAWAGDYQRGDFDRTDIVAGTGGRLRDDTVVFVSSGSTVDRLQSIEREGSAWVSNSLPCLLAAVGADLDPSFPQYFRHFRTVVSGLRRYARMLPTSAGPVQLVYFDNLVWDGNALSIRPKPGLGRDFSSFARFRGFLDESMESLAVNLADPRRKRPYTFLSTASSGYDSSTATVLGAQAGCKRVLCIEHDKNGHDDSGEPLADRLGLEVVRVKRFAWRDEPWPEVPFVAADAHGGDVFFKGAEQTLAGTVLLTGFHGDKMWDKHPSDLSDSIVRGDQSGLSLTEYRLNAGFLHCPVPFWGVRQIREVNALSQAAEMAPWDVPGDYSRPICRRIVEEAGIPRETFGTQKKATWVQFLSSKEFLSTRSLGSYLDWLRSNRRAWFRHGRVPPVLSVELDRMELAARHSLMMDPKKIRKKTMAVRVRAALSERPTRLRRYVFPWAIEQLRPYYPRPY